MRNSHKHNLKRITLELGGKSANIICDGQTFYFFHFFSLSLSYLSNYRCRH
jgi:hypothetical protein